MIVALWLAWRLVLLAEWVYPGIVDKIIEASAEADADELADEAGKIANGGGK